MEMYNPAHPGTILKEIYYPEIEKTIKEWAFNLGISREMLSKILNAKASITVDMALRFSKSLGLPAQFFLDMQQQYDLWQLKQRSGSDYNKIMPLLHLSDDLKEN